MAGLAVTRNIAARITSKIEDRLRIVLPSSAVEPNRDPA
jgi:hypothetical protein